MSKKDIVFCMNSFLIYRQVVKEDKSFFDNKVPKYAENIQSIPVYNVDDTFLKLKELVESFFNNNKNTALMLSGGIDSAILAALVPEGTKAYTFKPSISESVSEVEYARVYAERNNLDHYVIDISWKDYEDSMDDLMINKGAPIHSIEPQIYTAAKQAKTDGYDTLLFGEAADTVFGGLSGLLSKDFDLESFYERYMFVNPDTVLNKSLRITEPILPFIKEDLTIDVHSFLNNIFYKESNSSYENACQLAGIQFLSPYNKMRLENLNIERVRKGENKYILRDIFKKLYPDLNIRKKIPMPRQVDQWFENWQGPIRNEFKNDIDLTLLSGDQKWMIYSLERFLNLLDKN